MIIHKFWSIRADHLTGNSEKFVPAVAGILASLLNSGDDFERERTLTNVITQSRNVCICCCIKTKEWREVCDEVIQPYGNVQF
jgi:hypothetical protein